MRNLTWLILKKDNLNGFKVIGIADRISDSSLSHNEIAIRIEFEIADKAFNKTCPPQPKITPVELRRSKES